MEDYVQNKIFAERFRISDDTVSPKICIFRDKTMPVRKTGQASLLIEYPVLTIAHLAGFVQHLFVFP